MAILHRELRASLRSYFRFDHYPIFDGSGRFEFFYVYELVVSARSGISKQSKAPPTARTGLPECPFVKSIEPTLIFGM